MNQTLEEKVAAAAQVVHHGLEMMIPAVQTMLGHDRLQVLDMIRSHVVNMIDKEEKEKKEQKERESRSQTAHTNLEFTEDASRLEHQNPSKIGKPRGIVDYDGIIGRIHTDAVLSEMIHKPSASEDQVSMCNDSTHHNFVPSVIGKNYTDVRSTRSRVSTPSSAFGLLSQQAACNKDAKKIRDYIEIMQMVIDECPQERLKEVYQNSHYTLKTIIALDPEKDSEVIRAMKVLYASPSNCSQYNASRPVENDFYSSDDKFIGLAKRITSSINFSGGRRGASQNEDKIFAELNKQHGRKLKLNEYTLCCGSLCGTPDAVWVTKQSHGRPVEIGAVAELKWSSNYNQTINKHLDTRQLFIYMAMTGSVYGYFALGTPKGVETRLFEPVHVTESDENYQLRLWRHHELFLAEAVRRGLKLPKFVDYAK